MNFDIVTGLKLVAAAVAGLWGGIEPMVQLLILLMAFDLFTGFVVGFGAKALDSGIAFNGILKKVLILCLVGIGLVVEHYGTAAVPGMEGINLPLSEAIAGFFAAGEGLSCLENAAAAGVPIPQFLKDALAKLTPEPK